MAHFSGWVTTARRTTILASSSSCFEEVRLRTTQLFAELVLSSAKQMPRASFNASLLAQRTSSIVVYLRLLKSTTSVLSLPRVSAS